MKVLPLEVSERLKKVHNSRVGNWGLDICRRRLGEEQPRRGERGITDRMIKEFILQCPACQVINRMRLQIKTHRFTCAFYNPFEVLHLDHIGPLTKDAHGNEYILVIIDAFSRWVETAAAILKRIGRFGTPEIIHTRTKARLFTMS